MSSRKSVRSNSWHTTGGFRSHFLDRDLFSKEHSYYNRGFRVLCRQNKTSKMVRGGTGLNGQDGARTGFRVDSHPDTRFDLFGFRIKQNHT